MIIPLFLGFEKSQVVQDFVHQQYDMKKQQKNNMGCNNYWNDLHSGRLRGFIVD